MVWRSPRTWTAFEKVTAALMNEHVRDNLAHLMDYKAPKDPTNWTEGNAAYAPLSGSTNYLGSGGGFVYLAAHNGISSGNTAADNTTALNSLVSTIKTAGVPATIAFTEDISLSAACDLDAVDSLDIVGLGRPTITQTGTSTRVFRIFGNSARVRIAGLRLVGPHTAADNTAGNGAAIVIGHDISAQNGAVTRDITVEDCHISGFRHAGILSYGAAFGAVTPQRLEHIKIVNNTITDCQNGVFLYKNTHHAVVQGNTIRDTWDSGIVVDTRASTDTETFLSCTNLSIVGNVLDNTAVQGLSAQVQAVVLKGAIYSATVDGNVVLDHASSTANASINAYGINVQADFGSNPGRNITISGNSVDGVTGTGTEAIGINVNDASNVTVTANTVRAIKDGIRVGSANSVVVSSNSVEDTGSATDDYAIIITGVSAGTQSTSVTVAGNSLDRGTGLGSYAIFVAQTDDVVIKDNVYIGYPAEITRGGSVDRLQASLHASTTWDPASINAGTATHVDVAVPGAQIGDHVTVSFTSIGTEYLTISGQVRLAGSVRVVLANHATVAKDLALGDLRVRVDTVV